MSAQHSSPDDGDGPRCRRSRRFVSSPLTVLMCGGFCARTNLEATVADTSEARAPEEPKFQPYVKPEENRPEFTARAIFFGVVFGIIFGAVTVYVGLRAGLTVAASIPIAVLSISILRALGKA